MPETCTVTRRRRSKPGDAGRSGPVRAHSRRRQMSPPRDVITDQQILSAYFPKEMSKCILRSIACASRNRARMCVLTPSFIHRDRASPELEAGTLRWKSAGSSSRGTAGARRGGSRSSREGVPGGGARQRHAVRTADQANRTVVPGVETSERSLLESGRSAKSSFQAAKRDCIGCRFPASALFQSGEKPPENITLRLLVGMSTWPRAEIRNRGLLPRTPHLPRLTVPGPFLRPSFPLRHFINEIMYT